MQTQKIDIKLQDGLCDAFIAYPQDRGPYHAIILLMDAYGPRFWLYEMAQTLASCGYYVFLPNLFYRVRPAPVVDLKFPLKSEDMPEAVKQIMPLIQSLNPELTMRDMTEFFVFLAKQPQVLPGKIGITGYCMGGALAIRAAARFGYQVAAAASFHAGRLATDAPDSPHLLFGRIKAELYIAHADNDQSMLPEQIERVHSALQKTNLRYEAELYKGAAHGFTMADLPAYNEEALTKHWQKLFALFERAFC